MPRVTQYIRDEDFDKWKAVPNKSEFIHNALNPIFGQPIITKRSTANKIMKSVEGSSRFEQSLCRVHRLPLDARGRCLQKGCKYS